MMEVETEESDATDLSMECYEEDQDVLSKLPDACEEEEDDILEEAMQISDHLMDDDEERDQLPVRIIPIPVQPESSYNSQPANTTIKSAGSALSFMVNGQPVSMLPGGGTELRLHSHPGGCASGFTTVQVPVNVTIHSIAGINFINTMAPFTPAGNSSSAPDVPAETAPSPAPSPNPIPIITGVVSGEAAQKVLNDHNVNFQPTPLAELNILTSSADLPQKMNSPAHAASLNTKPRPSRPAAPHKVQRKGELGSISPSSCPVCASQYKLVPELRGFMCLCCPVINIRLKNLRRKNIKHLRRSRDKIPQTPTKSPRIQPALLTPNVVSPHQRSHRSSDDYDYLSDDFPSPPVLSPQKNYQALAESALPEGKLVILVEDFYYGSAPGSSTMKSERPAGVYRCIFCKETLDNNIKLMEHIQEHMRTVAERHEESVSVCPCPHCFRHFQSPYRRDCHIEAVHSQGVTPATCKICELAFDNEPSFLCHMKTTHRPGEMPYICQVCGFRSSFYSDVWSHFKRAHADSKHLLCQYCLRVLRSSVCYQQHVGRHQRKNMLACDKCRLFFLYLNERIEHRTLHHKTHVKPPQLCGLKPGTKVTVRTYSVIVGQKSEDGLRSPYVPSKVVDVPPPPPVQEAPKRKPVKSLGPLLSMLNSDRVSKRCVECLKSIPDLKYHFPSLVHCSLCRFVTCCSTAYANHMIKNHGTSRKVPQFLTIFKSDMRLSEALKCISCSFSTRKGDAMANHLTEREDHAFATVTDNELGAKRHKKQNSDSVQTGAFIPIHLLPSGQSSSQLSVKPITSLSPPSFTPAMTIRILGSQLQQGEAKDAPLSLSQLLVVLYCLCHGISQTAQHFQMSQVTIRSWIMQQQHGLVSREWWWRTDKMAEWVLNRREQQLSVCMDVLLMTAKATLGGNSTLKECYSWTIDFMLRHDLGLQTTNNNKLKSIHDSSRIFIEKLLSQNRGLPPNCWGCMDELPVFINSDLFSKQNPSAFQLFGSANQTPVFDIALSALADGTFLPPLLFFTGASSRVPDGFPNNVLLEARQEGFTDQDRLQIWIDKVWFPHVTSMWASESLLVVDVHRGHRSQRFRESLSSIKTDVAFIPSECSCRLQPLDVCVTQVLREFLQARWTLLVSDGGLDGLELDQLALTLACWLSEVSSTLNSLKNMLARSFSCTFSPEHKDVHKETLRMVAALTQTLIQPQETGGPAAPPGQKTRPEPTRQIKQAVALREKEKDADNLEEEMYKHGDDRSEDGQENFQETNKEPIDKEIEEHEFDMNSLPTLLQMFYGDSDQETFYGFPENSSSPAF
ncbi:pogo transposable element with ZNF domain [Cololabis saira]|uniref:pogo transposable element with ZNF domain n=1 Tax=Cololabis saira TaxID=129043 RepID=UPI002AD55E7C|nr:pogo transposable element with ZNF domain [Cololabis saira]